MHRVSFSNWVSLDWCGSSDVELPLWVVSLARLVLLWCIGLIWFGNMEKFCIIFVCPLLLTSDFVLLSNVVLNYSQPCTVFELCTWCPFLPLACSEAWSGKSSVGVSGAAGLLVHSYPSILRLLTLPFLPHPHSSTCPSPGLWGTCK